MPPPCLLLPARPARPAQVTPPSSSDDLTCFDTRTMNRSITSSNSSPASTFTWTPANRLFDIPPQNAEFPACTACIGASSSGHGIHASDNRNTSPKDSSSESEQVAVSTKSTVFLRESNDTDDTKGDVSDDDQPSPHQAVSKADDGQQHDCGIDLSAAYRNGRKGDPRMNVAVALKSTFPTMSLDDALKAGGFKFPPNYEKSSVTERNIFDEDNVSLQQRKNQLNRRIRYAKKFGKKTTNKKTNTKRNSRKRSRQQPKRNRHEDVATLSVVPSFPLLPSFPRPTVEMPLSAACQPSLGEPQCKRPRSAERSDSFLEEILELPGLDGLPDSIL